MEISIEDIKDRSLLEHARNEEEKLFTYKCSSAPTPTEFTPEVSAEMMVHLANITNMDTRLKLLPK